MTESFDVIVVGLGAMGSATTQQLAQRGARVLGIEMFAPGHDQGSSHGHHRKIRMSQLHNDDYLPIGKRTFELWRELERASGESLLRMTGEVQLRDLAGAPEQAAQIERMREQGHWKVLSETDLASRYPGFRLADGIAAVHEETSGYVLSEAGILASIAVARQHGATIHIGEEVTGWAVDGDGVRVTTNKDTYRAGRLVIATGPWAGELLRDLDFPLQVERTVNGYFQPDRPDLWNIDRGAPTFLLNVPEGSFYGIPAVDDVGLKIGMFGGRGAAITTPRSIDRQIDDSEIEALRHVLDRYMSGASGPELKRITCMCTYTSDSGFIVGHHPEHDQVMLGCGFNGRGFKFAPVIGEILAHLATDATYPLDISFMSTDRFSTSMTGTHA
jgi:sarcosine oxidase